MPPGKKRKATKVISRRKGGQGAVRGGEWVDCIRCGGGTNRCDLCRDNDGKVKVS